MKIVEKIACIIYICNLYKDNVDFLNMEKYTNLFYNYDSALTFFVGITVLHTTVLKKYNTTIQEDILSNTYGHSHIGIGR